MNMVDIAKRLDDIDRTVRTNGARGTTVMNLLLETVLAVTGKAEGAADSNVFLRFFDTLPIPAWLKILDDDGNLVMRWVNAAYEAEVGILPEKYIGRDDLAVWDAETAAGFAANDLKAITEKLVVETAEHARDKVWRGYKWPLVEGDDVVGVFGIALGLPA